MSNRIIYQKEDTCERCNSPLRSTHRPCPHHHYYPCNEQHNALNSINSNNNSSTFISNRDINTNNSINLNSSPLLYPKTSNDNHYTNMTPNPNNLIEHSLPSYNYINDLTAIHQKETAELQSKLFSLTKSLDSTKSNLTDQITTLQNKLKEQQSQSRLDIQTLNNQYSFELKRISSDKDNQIKLLIDKNIELSACNEELMLKLDKYISMVNDTKMHLSANVNDSQCEIEHLRNELLRQKIYYETKMDYCTKTNDDEKNKIVQSYDKTIAQLSLNYEDSKEKFQKILESRNKDVKEAIDTHQSDHDKLMMVNAEYKSQIEKLTEEKIELIRKNKEQLFEMERMSNRINESKNEIDNSVNDKMRYEAQIEELIRENDQLKIYNEKLNRLTHGKIRK